MKIVSILHKYAAPILLALLVLSCSSGKEATNNNRVATNAMWLLDSIPFDTSNAEERVKDLVINGAKYQMMELHADAILEFQEAVRYDSNAAIFSAIGASYMAMEKLELAMENFAAAARIDSSFLPAWDGMMRCYLLQYEVSEAIKIAEYAMTLDNSPKRLRWLALMYEFEDTDKAISIYEEILSKETDTDLLERLVYLYDINGREDEYYAAIKKLYAVDKGNIEYVMNMFTYYAYHQNYPELLSLMDEVDSNLYFDDLMSFYISASDYLLESSDEISDDFIDTFTDRAYGKFSDDTRVNIYLAGISLKHDNFDRAEKLYDKAIETDSASFEVVKNVHFGYFAYKYYEKAADILAKYWDRYSDSLEFPLSAAYTYYQMGNIDKAIEYANFALSKDSENYTALVQLGTYYNEKGLREETIEIFEKALSLYPNNDLLRNNYAYYLAEWGVELDKALRMADAVVSFSPFNATYLDTFGWVLFKLGRLDEAKKQLLKAVDMVDDTTELADVYEHLGFVSEALNEHEEAQGYWERALELEPNREHLIEKIK